jgi:hypothetical protein
MTPPLAESENTSHLQDRTNDLLLELESELGKDAANQFILIRSAIYYGDNGLPGIGGKSDIPCSGISKSDLPSPPAALSWPIN